MNGSNHVLSQPMNWMIIKELNNQTEWQIVWDIFEKEAKKSRKF